MARNSTIYVCNECGHETRGWMGKCPACNTWNSMIEEICDSKPNSSIPRINGEVKLYRVEDISLVEESRFKTGINEMDRVLGGGIVPGSLILVGGDPGIGKSTLILQICETIVSNGTILYISGEESVKQIKIRADRLLVRNNRLFIVSETSLEIIKKLIEDEKPSLVIIDSIQTVMCSTLNSAAGSVSQVREVTANLVKIAKTLNVSIIIVGHVTKDGAIAGPRVLEHMVDTVLYFEGDRHSTYRILRGVKNRFGSTNEIGIFEMREKGLIQIENPSQIMMSGRPEEDSGSVVVSSLEGSRPMLIEIQALVCPSGYGIPRRMSTGVDTNRVILLMAVLEKRLGMQLGNFDAYVNVIGGIRIDEPACDMGIITALASSFKDRPIDKGSVVIGEVGLTGEVRGVSQIEKRVLEAQRIGFTNCVIPMDNYKTLCNLDLKDMRLKPVDNVRKVLDLIM